jgi:hypothetical protein
LVSEPVEFPLFVSSTRLTDKPGELVPIDRERMTPLPPIRTVLRAKKKDEGEIISVNLHARLTEIGTLDLWCSEVGGRRSWRLQFDVRSATQTDIAAHQSQAEGEGVVDEATWQACQTLLHDSFAPEGSDKPERLMKRLAAAMSMSRNLWPTSLCRRIWETLMELESGRRRSATHEARWLNLLGFALRPGYGLALDDWRVAQTWTVLQGKFAHASAMVRTEGWILWRRIGGGLAGATAGVGRSAARAGARFASPIDHGQGPRRVQLCHSRNGRNVAAAWFARTAAEGNQSRTRRDVVGHPAEAKNGAGAAGDGMGHRTSRRAVAALWPVEHGDAR